jgi:glycosyltransferase involved in cell wall biosynthesis
VTRRRIGLVIPGFSTTESDWCIPALLDLVRGLARADDVTVFSLRYPHHRRPYEVAGARVVPFGAAQARGLGRLLLFLRAGRYLRRAARAGEFDVLHALWAHEPGAIAAWACRGTGTPLVVSLLGGELAQLRDIRYGGGQEPVNRRLASRALRRARLVTIGSETLRAPVPAGFDSAPWRLWPLGVATARFHPLADVGQAPRLDGTPCVLSVASLVPVKDHATLLRAFATLAPTARLHLVGAGPLEDATRELAQTLGIAERVRFHGALSHELLPGIYRQADVLVVSSRFESQCLAALEAAACGTPVVGTRVGALPDVAAPEALCSPGQAAALAACMRRQFTRARDGSLATRTAQRYGLERCLLDLRRLYDELLPVPA